MPNITSMLNQHIRSLARRELKGLIVQANKRGAEHRRSIAALKREVVLLRRELATVKKHAPNEPVVAPAALENKRLRIDGLKAHRAKLGLSARDYGKLLGVSGLTVYNWEGKRGKPRRSMLPRIVAVRGLGKREALERLESK